MGLWDRWNEYFSHEPPTTIEAELESADFLEEVSISIAPYDSEHEYDLVLVFSQPLRQENDVSHFNIRNRHGEVVDRFAPPSGATSSRYPIAKDARAFDLLTIDDDSDVPHEDRILIREVPIE